MLDFYNTELVIPRNSKISADSLEGVYLAYEKEVTTVADYLRSTGKGAYLNIPLYNAEIYPINHAKEDTIYVPYGCFNAKVLQTALKDRDSPLNKLLGKFRQELDTIRLVVPEKEAILTDKVLADYGLVDLLGIHKYERIFSKRG